MIDDLEISYCLCNCISFKSLMILYLLIIDQVAEKTRHLISINHKFDLINEGGVHWSKYNALWIFYWKKKNLVSRTDKIQSINFVPYAKISRFETLETGFRKEVSTPWNNNVLRYVSPENQSSRKEVIQVGRAKTWKIRAMHGLSSQFTPPSLYSKLVYIHNNSGRRPMLFCV